MNTSTLISSLFLISILFIGGLIIYHQGSTFPVASTFVLNPTPTPQLTKAPEPIITSWTTYTNDKYNFRIDIPEGWNQQEFTPESGGLIVAFSPNTLPCKTCTYVHDGYYSVRIFNQKTDPQAFTDFTAKQKSVGQNRDVLPVRIGGLQGVLFANSVAVENHGWVYTISLDADNGNDKAIDSQLFQKTAGSFAFTYLIFSK